MAELAELVVLIALSMVLIVNVIFGPSRLSDRIHLNPKDIS